MFQTEEASPSFQRAGSVGAGPAGKTDNQESDPASNEILTTFTNLLRQQINTATVNMLQGLVECESKKAGYRHEEPLYPQSDLYCKVNMLTSVLSRDPPFWTGILPFGRVWAGWATFKIPSFGRVILEKSLKLAQI